MKVNDKCKITKDAIENYGDEYRDIIFVVAAVSDKYMPAKQFYALNMPDGYHPGYDSEIRENLYDLKFEDGSDFGNSLYEWELSYIEE